MERQGSGVVVNAGSLAGLRGSGGLSGYASSKHAVLGITKVASSEVAPHGVRVVAIAPGPVEGPMFRGHLANMAPDVDATYEKMIAGIPQRRVATPEDIANLVCFLGSDQASHITGGAYSIDGGLCAG
jgi:NAD(P)-dependent dehydrogenase (short-subunit alcohol dehydrogenase family)